MSTFRMSKWYLDCVTDSGDVSIAYTGSLQWGPVHLHYSNLREGGVLPRTQDSLWPQPEPEIENSVVRWHSKALSLTAEWTRDVDELRETLFESAEGTIEWRCVAPRAWAKMGNFAGLGYVEQIMITVPPSKIPIQTITWGRFLTPTDWIVWLAWTQPGCPPRQILYLNGAQVPNPVIEDDELRFGDGSRLTLDRSLQIRTNDSDTSSLGSIPGLSGTFPMRLLQLNESKWRSKGALERPGQPDLEGWAIHEELVWPGA
jgi:hypothetical protein